MSGSARWSIPALVLVAACAFDSGGVYDNGTAASIGSQGSTEGDPDTETSTTASSNTGSASTTAADPTTNADSSASTTASVTTTDDDSTGAVATETGTNDSSSGHDSSPLETGGPMEESSGQMMEETGVDPPDPPYYADCGADLDCGATGACFMTPVFDAPDAHVCLLPCGDGCPDPEDGTATTVCTSGGWCMLSCADDPDCPMGMDCYSFNGGEYRRCLWSQG